MTALTPPLTPTPPRSSTRPGGARPMALRTTATIVAYVLALCAAWLAAGVPGAAAVGLAAFLVEFARTPSGRRRVCRARG